jgi:DNA-binding transcriptional ArsR family regulator
MEMEMTAEEARHIMEVLGGGRRFSLLQGLLENGTQSVAALNGSSTSGSNMSHHLKDLREAGIVRTEGRGSQRLNSVNLEVLMNLAGWLNEAVFYAQLNRLTEFLENTPLNEPVLSKPEHERYRLRQSMSDIVRDVLLGKLMMLDADVNSALSEG